MARASDNPWDSLTETQKRRLHLRLRGYSYRQIASLECVDVKSVWQSLLVCRKKISALGDVLSLSGMR